MKLRYCICNFLHTVPFLGCHDILGALSLAYTQAQGEQASDKELNCRPSRMDVIRYLSSLVVVFVYFVFTFVLLREIE